MKEETERNKAVYEERLKGTTFRKIAEMYSISPSRAEGIVYREQMKEVHRQNSLFRLIESMCSDEQLFTRMITVLKRSGITTEEAFMDLDIKTLRKTRGCGEKMQEFIFDVQDAIRNKYTF